MRNNFRREHVRCETSKSHITLGAGDLRISMFTLAQTSESVNTPSKYYIQGCTILLGKLSRLNPKILKGQCSERNTVTNVLFIYQDAHADF